MKADDEVYPHEWNDGENSSYVKGLTVRDHIAIQAMQSLIIVAAETAKAGCKYDLSEAVEDAYKTADAMIEQSQQD